MSRKKTTVLDPSQLLNDIVASGFDLSRFRQVDESGINQPLNFFEWITGRDFCNTTILPWQIEQGMKLFSDYCPTCSNPLYIEGLYDQTMAEIQDNIVFLEDGQCPKCKHVRTELFTFTAEPNKPSLKNEYIACTGQRAGKSKSIALYTSYQMNRWLALPDPINFYGLPTMELVIGSFSALSSEQAEENLWIPFKGLYDQAPWFERYNAFLKQEEKRLGVPLLQVRDTYIMYLHKRFLTEFSGSDDRKKRGRTRLWGVIDEIAFLNSETNSGSKKKTMDADKNYAALNNSLSTIRQKAMRKLAEGNYNTQMAIMHNASSPYNAMDKIMRLVKGATENRMAQVVHKATWELNPDYTQVSTRQQNAALSQVEFDRDFGAVPPYSDSPYIGDARVMEKLCNPKHIAPLVATPQTFIDGMGDKYLYLEAKFARLDKGTPRLLALDNGYKQNAFAVALFRYDMMLRKPVLDFAFSLYPQPDIGLTVNFPMMFDQFIVPLVKNLRILHVFYDRWQSLDQIQRLRNEYKVDAQAHSLSYEKDFLPFRQQLVSGNMVLPPLEMPIHLVKESPNPLGLAAQNPTTNLIWQALTVREAGRKILKPLEGDDDLFRAFVLGGSRFLDENIKKKYLTQGGVGAALNRAAAVGTFTSQRSPGAAAGPSSAASQRVASFARVKTIKGSR